MDLSLVFCSIISPAHNWRRLKIVKRNFDFNLKLTMLNIIQDTHLNDLLSYDEGNVAKTMFDVFSQVENYITVLNYSNLLKKPPYWTP